MTKSYSDMKASELRSEAAALNLDSSGVKNRLLQRLVKYDRDQLDFEDMSTDWLRSKLEEEKVIVPKSRKGMIEILIRADADEMELGDFNDWVLDHYWDEFKTRYDLPSKNGVTRTEKLKQLRTLQIKELKQKCRELDRKLYECQHQVRPAKNHGRPRTFRDAKIFNMQQNWRSKFSQTQIQDYCHLLDDDLMKTFHYSC